MYRIFRIGLILVMLFLPVAVLYTCIYNYGVNVVFWDEWNVVCLYDDIQSNGLSFAKLFAQNNEHRMFFPRIFMLLFYRFTKWNTKGAMYISAFLISLSYYYVLKYASGKKRLLDFSAKDVLFFTLLGFCLMSTCQYENLLWGFQFAWFLIETCVIASLVFFEKYYQCGKRKDCIISVLLATVATYSSLQGVAVWFLYLCIFIMLMISERKYLDRKIWIPYVVLGILEVVMYFQGYTSVGNHENYRMANIGQCFQFMVSQLGYIFCDSNEKIAEYLGIFLIAVVIILISYLMYRKKAEEYLLSIGMIIFGMGVTLMISIGRSNLSFASRYTTYALMFLIGVLSVIYREVNQNFSERAVFSMQFCQIFIAVEGMLIALCIVENLRSLEKCAFLYQDRIGMVEILQNYKEAPLEALNKSFPWANYEDAFAYIDILARKNWSVWD